MAAHPRGRGRARARGALGLGACARAGPGGAGGCGVAGAARRGRLLRAPRPVATAAHGPQARRRGPGPAAAKAVQGAEGTEEGQDPDETLRGALDALINGAAGEAAPSPAEAEDEAEPMDGWELRELVEERWGRLYDTRICRRRDGLGRMVRE